MRREKGGRAHAHDTRITSRKITNIVGHGAGVVGERGAWARKDMLRGRLVRKREGGVIMRVKMMSVMVSHAHSQRSHV